jgi:hypothetical protein
MPKTYLVDIPQNPYFFPNQLPAPPSASGLICLSPPTKFRISNKIKITIPDDPVFSGTYVWDRQANSDNWILNTGESQIRDFICDDEIDQNYTLGFVEVNNASQSYPASFEETYTEFNLEVKKVYAFPAKYYMYATLAAETSESMGHRLSVGFTMPIRYRHAYGDWIVVDRLIQNGIKTPHILNGSPNYAIVNEGPDPTDNTISYKYINPANNMPICSSGLNELGFSFKTSASGLGVGCFAFGQPYPYFDEELPYFEPKVGVKSLLEFVYDCREGVNCGIVNSLSGGSWIQNTSVNNVCYGSTINVTYNCVSDIIQSTFASATINMYFIVSNNYRIYLANNTFSNYLVDNTYKKLFHTTFTGYSYNDIIQYVNSSVAIYPIVGDKYGCLDLYWETISSNEYNLYIIPSDDC